MATRRAPRSCGHVSQAMQALRTLLGEGDMLAYLAMMAPRLVELRRVLRPTGSVYLHCDPTAGHYLSEDVRRGGNPLCQYERDSDPLEV